MMDFNSYVQGRVEDLMREAKSEHLLKEAVAQNRISNPRRPLRESVGERFILLGWRLMNKAPEDGETCSRLMLSGHKQAIVMVEVCL